MTINGIGTRLLNCSPSVSEAFWEGYIWFTFLYAPVFPLRKVRFYWVLQDQNFEFQEIEKLPMNGREIVWSYIKGWILFPVLLFWPIPFLVTEVYHGMLHLPDGLYNWLFGFGIIYLIVVIWILADRYEAQGLPPDHREQLKARESLGQNELNKSNTNGVED